MKVFFWQNMPSHLQSGSLDHFASIWPEGASGVWVEDISADRLSLGWSRISNVHLEDVFLPLQDWKESVTKFVELNCDDIHILSGIGAYPPITFAAHLLKKIPNVKLGLIVEPSIMMGWKRFFRPLKAWWCYREFFDKISVVLAMGSQGIEFYRRLGFSDKQLFPFLYQSPFGRICLPAEQNGRKTNFVYLGQFHHRKGVDLLLKALIPLVRFPDWRLTLYGSGPQESLLRGMIKNSDLEGRVEFGGSIRADQVIATLSEYDVCCIPSRFDGWGVVTNEALQAGIPVIVSNTTGSSDLVRYSGAGKIFNSGNVQKLTCAMEHYIADPDRVNAGKKIAVEYSDRILPPTAAEYLKLVFEHVFCENGPRPQAPWIIGEKTK